MRPTWRTWIGPVVVALVAVALWFLGSTAFEQRFAGWIYLGWGLAGAVTFVAASSYRSRRDPTLLFIAAGAAAFGLEWLLYAVSVPGAGRPAWVLSLGLYGLLTGPLALAACLVGTVPWRDRRGRPPLRVRSVTLGVAGPLLVLSVWLIVSTPQPTDEQIRVLSGVTALLALVAATRSVARGGWHGWSGGGAFALVISSAAAWAVMSSETSVSEGALSWFTYMPSVALAAVLAGVLAAQRADTSRMRRASDRATEVMEGRAEIASIVAHDVRGPAGTIRSVAGSLRTSYDRLGEAERLEFVGMIEQESLRLLRVADQMSLGLKVDAATLPYAMVERDLEGPVLQGLHDADPDAREIRLEVDHDLRACVDGRWIAEAVRQGIENALKFSPQDSPVDIRVSREAGQALIQIEDRGPSVPADMREAVFEKFSRWRPAGYQDVSGSGLGLFIVRSIARAHGGDATLTSRDGTGTILEIRLPMEGPGEG